MKKYSKYKKTNIDWIGEIPDHWDAPRLKYLATIRNGKDPKSVQSEAGQYPIYGTGGIFGKSNEYLYDKPSVLLGRKGTIDKPQLVDKPFWSVDTAYYTEIDKDVDIKFFFYLTKTLIPFDLLSYGSAVPSMTQSDLNEVRMVKPDKKEQTQIATYLDHRTALIDKLIASNEKQIKLLEEKRKATINQAITKGLDPNVKMKDSGVEWIGEIPEGWEVKKLKYSVQLLSDKGDNYKKIALENIQSKTGRYIETDTTFHGDGVEFNKGDILFGKLRPYLAKVWEAEFQGSAVGDFFVMRPNKTNNPTYRKYQILSDLIINVLNGSTYGAKMPRVSWDFMGELLLPEPPIEQQEQIATYLSEINQEIEELIRKVVRQNKLLKEYRQSLISHVVTGKVDVRGENI